VQKFDTGEVFLTALAKSFDSSFLATGNNNGDVYIKRLGSAKDKIVNLKAHYKLVRDLTFLDDSSKLLTACDDSSIKVIDVSS
jgi:WD40 repeat protein